MSPAQILFLLAIFAVASVGAYFALARFAPRVETKRLDAIGSIAGSYRPISAIWRAAAGWGRTLQALLAKLSVPKEKWEDSPLRVRFMNAGFRSGSAPVVFLAAKTALTFVLPGLLVGYIAIGQPQFKGQVLLMLLLACAALGYYLPNLILARMVTHRRRELFENLPDALDLMRICVEAGLGLDAAIARVGEEIRVNSEALYEELHLVVLELRAGASRERALSNFALRMGLEEADALVAMLIQAERFGTSIGDSLRVHSDGLRQKRRFRAEEIAAKIPVKLLFPLIFCMFPAFMVVLLGPAFISIYRLLFTTFAGE